MRWCSVLTSAIAIVLAAASPVEAQQAEADAPVAAEELEPAGEDAAEPAPAEPAGEDLAEGEPDQGAGEPEEPAGAAEPEEPAGTAEPEEPPLEAPQPEALGAASGTAEVPPVGAEAPTESVRRQVGTEMVYADALPFRSSIISYQNVFSAHQLDRGADLTYNPYYAMSLGIQPRWYFTERLSVRLGLEIETELTNSDSTTDYHETRLSDLNLDLVYDPIVRIPVVGVSVGAGFRFAFPTSLSSQAETRYLALGPELRLARVFPVLDGLVLAYGFRYMKSINRYTTSHRESNPYTCTRTDLACLANSQLGDMATSHTFGNALLFQLRFLEDRFRPMAFTIGVTFLNSLAYPAPEATVQLIGGHEVEVEHIEDPVTHAAAIMYMLALSIDVTDYLGLSIGASTFTPQLRPDSSYREPFFNRYTNLYVDLSLDIERLVAVFRGSRQGGRI